MKSLLLLPIVFIAGCSSSKPTVVVQAPPPVVSTPLPLPVVPAAVPTSTPFVVATPSPVDNGSSRNGINDIPAPILTRNPFFFDASAMPNSVESALAAIDRASTSDELHRLLSYLSEARAEFREREQQCSITDRRCVIVYSLCQDAILAVYNYAQYKADGLDGRLMDIAARNGMRLSATSARNRAVLADDNVTGQAAQNSQQTVRRMRQMLQEDSYRLRRR